MENNTWTEQVIITPEMAQFLLEDWAYDRQRNLSTNYILKYANDMKQGYWRDTPPLMAGIVGNCKYLLNGRHRLHAIIKSETSQLMTILYKKVSSIEDLGLDYIVEDNGRSRNDLDRMRAYCQDESDIKYVGATAAAVKFIHGNFKPMAGSALSAQGALALISEWRTESVQYIDLIKGHTGGLFDKMRRRTVMSVGLVTLRYANDRAASFWRAVAQNDGLRRGQAEHALVNFLLTVHPDKLIGRDMEYSRKVASCWNSYYTENELIYPKCLDHTKPILLKGTPFKG